VDLLQAIADNYTKDVICVPSGSVHRAACGQVAEVDRGEARSPSSGASHPR